MISLPRAYLSSEIHVNEAFARELADPSLDFQGNEEGGGTTRGQAAALDDPVDIRGLLADDVEEQLGLVVLLIVNGGSLLDRRGRHAIEPLQRELADHVLPARDEGGAILDEAMGAHALGARHEAWHRHHLASELAGQPRGGARAAALRGLHHHHA